MIISVLIPSCLCVWCSKISRWTEGAELLDGRGGIGGRKRGMRGTEGAVLEGSFLQWQRYGKIRGQPKIGHR